MPKVPGVVLFSRSSQDGDTTADDWDDTELLKEYDKAVRPIKALVAERMGMSPAELEEASASESCASSAQEASKSLKRNQKKRRRKNKHKQHREWAAGDHCQAMFTDDKKWYEATILSIDPDQSTCVVQYVGYGNTEEQPLSAIGRSMGAAVRREQGHIASLEKDSEAEANQSDEILERSSQASSSISFSKDRPSARKAKNNIGGPFQSSHSGKVPGQGFPRIPEVTAHPLMHDMVPPPLPPHILSSLPDDDSEALSAMLMSWYMSGFHTGYYQGMKRSKNCSNHRESSSGPTMIRRNKPRH